MQAVLSGRESLFSAADYAIDSQTVSERPHGTKIESKEAELEKGRDRRGEKKQGKQEQASYR